jgi:O-antigen/teichoic acid export membrane protein
MLSIPLILDFIKVPASTLSDARALFTGSILIAGLSLPMRGVPGLMTAQERFHWIPLMQGIVPWVNLAGFAILLSMGWGVKSYIYAMAGSQLFSLAYFWVLVRTSPIRPGWNRGGLSKARFRSLFGFSLSLSAVGLVEAVMTSLPGILLARAGALTTVPLYVFSNRGPSMLLGLVRRTTHAFYPRLMRLYVEGKKEAFGIKFNQVGQLTLSIGLIASGIVLTANRPLVELLAGPDFYIGSRAVIWFAIGVIILPFAGLFGALRQISGAMGMTALIAFLKLLIAIFLAIPMYRTFGVEGLAAIFAIIPLMDAAYGYFRGSINCGFRPWQLSGKLVMIGCAYMAIVGAGGYLIARYPSTGALIQLVGKPTHLPGLSELLVGGTVVLLGALFASRSTMLRA